MTPVPDIVRTPDERFRDLPGFPFEPHYEEVGGLRLARVDEGAGAPVLFLHGEPTWSFLWRTVLPAVRDAGFRCIAPDLPGFGRSDKPVDPAWYSYDRHTELIGGLVERLDLREATLVVHDWGGPIGLRLAVEMPDRFARLVIMDTGVFTGHQRMSDTWTAFRDFVAASEDLAIDRLIRAGCHDDPGEAVLAAYAAPFPTPESKAGARAFPQLIPTTPEAPGADAGRQVLEALAADARPKLVLWADGDAVLPLAVGRRFAELLGTEVAHVVEGAGHFLQEDRGREIGELIANWLTS
jgi:haloalkane dehalogenase